MLLKVVSRKKFLDVLQARGVIERGELNSTDQINVLPGNSDDIQLIWNEEDLLSNNNRDSVCVPALPQIIVVGTDRKRDFLAWVWTYLPDFRPLTAYARVLDGKELRSFAKVKGTPVLGTLEEACLGLIVGEAATYIENRQDKKLIITPLSCASTCSHAMARALALSIEGDSDTDDQTVPTGWMKARNLTRQRQLKLKPEELALPWRVLLRIHSTEEGYQYASRDGRISFFQFLMWFPREPNWTWDTRLSVASHATAGPVPNSAALVRPLFRVATPVQSVWILGWTRSPHIKSSARRRADFWLETRFQMAIRISRGHAPSMSGGGKRNSGAWYGFAALVLAGIVFRILVVVLPGQKLQTPWSGGSDTPAYVLLAENLLAGKGLSYAGQPSAFRPPAYPLLLAGLRRLFGQYYVVAVRWLQFAAGLATVSVCAAASARLFGGEAGKPAALFGLFLPTLVWTTSEVLTENIAALLAVAFLYFLSQELERPRWANTAGLGISAGTAALFRYNMAALVLVGLWVTLSTEGMAPRWQRVTVMLAIAALIVSPWIVRNYLVFQGQALFSTQGGAAAALGIITPQGRSQPGETEMLKRALGWAPPQDLETNGVDRARLPGEPELNREAWRAARQRWRETGWDGVPIVLGKWANFWLSTDQMFSTGSFSVRRRLVRAGGVLAYWAVLALGIAGWFRLRTRFRAAATALLFYAVFLTALHSVFTMNTRLRIPFMDPLLVILAGGGCLALLGRWREGAAAKRLGAFGGA